MSQRSNINNLARLWVNAQYRKNKSADSAGRAGSSRTREGFAEEEMYTSAPWRDSE